MSKYKMKLTFNFDKHNENLVRSTMFTAFKKPQKIIKIEDKKIEYFIVAKQLKTGKIDDVLSNINKKNETIHIKTTFLKRKSIYNMLIFLILVVIGLSFIINQKEHFYMQHTREKSPFEIEKRDENYEYKWYRSDEELIINYMLNMWQRRINGDIETSLIAYENINDYEKQYFLVTPKKEHKNDYVMEITEKEMNNLENFTNYTSKNAEIGLNMIYFKDYEKALEEISRFEKTLVSYDSGSKKEGFWKMIDVDQFIDFFILTEITMNQSAGKIETYFYKKDKLKVANTNYEYIFQGDKSEFILENSFWYEYLLKNADFCDKLIKRYENLRKSWLSEEEIEKTLREICDFSQVKESEKIEAFLVEIIERGRFLDKNIEVLKLYSHYSVNKQFNYEEGGNR